MRVFLVWYGFCMKNITHITLGKSKKAGTALVNKEDQQRVEEAGTWHLHATGYVYRNKTENKQTRTIYLHRFIVGLEYGDGLVIDHIDGNKLNNTKENLRVLSPGENCQNKTKTKGASKYRGVSKHRDGWVGSVNVPGGDRLRRVFETEDAAALWCQEQRDKHQPFANPDPEVVELKEMIESFEELRQEMADEHPDEYTNSEEHDWTYDIQALCQDLGVQND